MQGPPGYHGSRPRYPQWPGAERHGVPPRAPENDLWPSTCQWADPPGPAGGRPAASCRFPGKPGPASGGIGPDVRPMSPTPEQAPPAAGPSCPDSLAPCVWFPQTKGCVCLGCFHGLYFTDSGVACMCPRPLGPRGPCCSAVSIACRSPGALLLGRVHCLLLRRSLAVSVGARPVHRRSASPVPRVLLHTISGLCLCHPRWYFIRHLAARLGSSLG